MLGVWVTLQLNDDFDRERLVAIASESLEMFDGMPGLRNKFFTVDEKTRRAVNFYAWEWEDQGLAFFSEEVVEQIAGVYGVRPTIEFVEIVELVDNSHADE